MASGNTLCVFFPRDGESPAANYATPDLRNGVSVLDFDATADESMEFAGFMPRHYSGLGITITFGWMATTAETGTISLEIGLKSVTDDADDLDTKAFDALRNANAAPASATGEVQYTTIAFTDGDQMDFIAAGEYFRMIITRDAVSGTSTDDMVNDMEMVFVEIRET